MPSVLPAALVSNPATIEVPAAGGGSTPLTGFSPDVAADPINSSWLVEVHTTGSALVASFSEDGGQTWTSFINAQVNVKDPTTNAPFTTVTDPTVAIDRAQNIYITDIERNATLNTSGALVFQRWYFLNNGGLSQAVNNNVIQEWVGADPIENPVVAVDNNVTSFTDTTAASNRVQTDTMATIVGDPTGANTAGVNKALYVAYNTTNKTPANAPNNWEANVIMATGSGDGGTNWAAPQIVSDGGNTPAIPNGGVTPHYSDPQLVFTQGSADGRVTGGQLTFAWNDYGNNTFQLDASQPDNAVAANPAAASYSFNGGTGTFLDAGSFVSSVSINNGGNNYTTGNVLTAAGGTIYPAAPPTETPGPQPGSQATFNTTENNSPGPVTGVSIGNPGFYIVRPGTPNTATGGAGSGASLNLGFTDVPETRTYTDNVILPNNFNVNDLQVTLDLTDPRVQDLTIELDAPGVSPGNGIFLVEYPTSKISGANLGEITTGGTTYDVGTVFDDDAPRSISDASFTAPYIARFTPQVGKLDIPGVTTGTNVDNGSWTLRVTDNVNDNTATAPVESVDNWTLTFSHISTTGFGTDRTVPGLSALTGVPPVTGAANEPYPLVTNASGPQGISPGISLAVDNTLGAYSPYEGRIYLAYTAAPPKGNPATDTNIDLITGDNLRPNRAPTWSTPVQVNDDSVTDGFSEGTRPQFMPTVAVDQTTGTVGVMYYDGRWDPSLFRVANSFSDSIDGGHTFSTSTFLNTPKTATDAITEQSITIEPVPGNQGQVPAVNGTSFGFGDRQGLVMVAGHVIPVFASNDNIAGSFIKSATVTLAAGPRIIFGDMGPIVADFTSPVGTATYNNTFAADGTRQFNGFVIEFDRPVVVSSFTPNQVTIVYHDTVTPAALPGVTIPTADYTVNPLDGFTPFGRLPASTDNVLATTFLVQLNTGEERSAVGTYSYAIGNLTGAPTINDGIKTVASPTVGNFMDQNQNAVTGEVPNSTSPGDVFAVPTPTAGPPFQLPYDSSTLPLIIPGPHVTSTSVAFNPAASTSATDNLVLNGTNNGVDVTFDRNIQPATFTPANVLRIEGPLGPITTYTLGPAVSFSGGGGSGASGIATIVGGLVTAVTITNSGSGYTSAPTVVFTGGGGVGAIGAATIAGGKVTGVTVTSGGVGYTSTPAQTIPAAGTLNVPLTITDSLQVNDLSVGLDITQANVSALAVTLIAPDGTQVQLVPAGTLSGANLTAAIFDDFASTLITAGTAPYSGLFRPVPPVLAAAISAGGSGYKVGDILTVQGGTFLTPAQLKVTSVAGGAVTGVTIVQSGAYSVEPYNPVSVTDATTPAASGATFTLSFGGLSALNGKNYLGTWTLRIQNSGAAGTLNAWSLNPVTVSPYTLGVSSAVPVNAAKNYNVFDILTVMGGTFAAGQQAQLLVTSVSATGAITGVFVLTPGLYALKPGTPVTVIGGTGTGATFTLGYTAATTATTFHISFPTQTVSGTYTVVVGPDSQGNYIEDTSLDRATVVTGGSGYNVGDLLTVKGGTGTAAEFQVTTVNGGAITGVELVDPGSYTVNPPSTTGVTDVTTPSAANATLTLFFGNKVDTSLDAGVDLLRGVVINGGTLLQAPYASGLINTPLPAGQTVESTINVPDSYIVQGATVTLTIKHNNDPDLVATLIAPDGTSDLLFSGVGASGSSPHANFTNTTLDDAALTPIQLATTVPGIGIGAGPYNPQQPLTTAFKGHGSLGSWTLEITSNSSTINGTLVSWSLNLKNTVDGVGALVASQFTAPFRIFTQDPTNSVSQQSWTAVGPASINNGGDSGRIGGLAVDPSDPSGNTVYTAGASGGVWKTTDFMTTNPNGPTWIPLTNLGPANSLNTGSIAVFGRNNNPNQSIIFVATGEGSTSTPGVGFLRSMDGGRTWEVLDSSTNVDAAGNILPISSASRDHKFVGSTAFKVVVDPKPAPTGQVIVYAALSSGVWRSVDTGQHWTLMQAGDASDVVLAAGSAGSTGNLQILYAAVEGKGVYFTNNATATLAMTLQNGNSGNAIRRDVDVTPDQAIPITNDGVNPSQGGGGRITLAAPALTGNPLEDTLYEGWCYAVVATAGGAFGGLYVTKDFGLNWTKVRLPVLNPFKPTETSTNNDSIATDDSVTGSAQFPQANYNV
ncbi:MAG TPA: proprotein convertase P-domain-containing protein, partial [Gemmataceae bacterium]|nr:proprotein convertase P-domain-containing protein [Gemmataceae bacterium]